MSNNQWKPENMNTEGTIMIGVPRERTYIPKFVDNLWLIINELGKTKQYAGHYIHEGHRVDRNRDHIVEYFLKQNPRPEWLLMLDTDMDHVVPVGQRLAKHGKPIVGALYFHRGGINDPFMFKELPEPEIDAHGRETYLWVSMRDQVYDFLIANKVPMQDGSYLIENPVGEALVECDAVATGAMLIHRSVLEQMPKPLFEYRAGGQSEDLRFCYEAKRFGIPVYCDMSTVSGHYAYVPIGQKQFRENYVQRGLRYSSYDVNDAIQMLSEFLNISGEAAAEMIQKGNAHMVGNYWEAKKPADEKQEIEFYQDPYTGRLYLIELLHWNASPVFLNIRSRLIEHRDKKVMVLGDGIGTVSLQMRMQRCDVDSVEINQFLSSFIRYRHDKIESLIPETMGEIKYIDDRSWMEASDKYDLVIAIDVFEHIPEEELQITLNEISSHMNPGGIVYYHANFKQQDLYPMHHDFSSQWAQWIEAAGFMPLNEIMMVKR